MLLNLVSCLWRTKLNKCVLKAVCLAFSCHSLSLADEYDGGLSLRQTDNPQKAISAGFLCAEFGGVQSVRDAEE
jgi:hypothetical protein